MRRFYILVECGFYTSTNRIVGLDEESAKKHLRLIMSRRLMVDPEKIKLTVKSSEPI